MLSYAKMSTKPQGPLRPQKPNLLGCMQACVDLVARIALHDHVDIVRTGKPNTTTNRLVRDLTVLCRSVCRNRDSTSGTPDCHVRKSFL